MQPARLLVMTWLEKVVLLVLLLSSATGCALVGQKKPAPPPLDAGDREKLGKIALVWEDDRRTLEYDEPASKEGKAAEVLSAGASGTMMAGGLFLSGLSTGSSSDIEDYKILGALAGAVGVVFAAPVALHGAVDFVGSESAFKLRSARIAMQQAAGDVYFSDELRRRLQDSIHDQTPFCVTMASVPELDRTRERPTYQNIYRSLGVQGYDTVLEVQSQAALEGEKRFTLEANVWVNVVEIATGRELFSQQFCFRSKRRKFSDWAKNDAQKFRTALGQCYAQLTDEIMRQLFLAR